MKKLSTISLLILLALPSATFASSPTVTGAAHQFTQNHAASTDTVSLDFTDTTGQNKMLVVYFSSGNLSSVTGITWNGTSMTRSDTFSGTNIEPARVYTLANPDVSAAHNLVISYNPTFNTAVTVTAFVLQDAMQSSFVDQQGYQGNASATSVSTPALTSSSTSVMLGSAVVDVGISGLAATNGTALGSAQQQTTYENVWSLVSWRPATGAADTLGYSWTTSKSSDSYAISIKYQAPSGGGGGPGGNTPSCDSPLQYLIFTYDAIGNITNVTDCSNTGTGKKLTFVYDDLSRLTSASTTAASSTSYRHSFSYDWLGSITGFSTTTSATSTYTYAGTGNANPHAPTGIGATTLSYDNNGNLATSSPWGYQWDWRNRLKLAGNGTATSTYTYDDQNNRVTQVAAGTTTTYPNKYVSVTGASTTDYIYIPGIQGDVLVAAVEANGTATTTRYMHPDNLGSTNVVTNATGSPIQALDYYPYGSGRIASSSSSQDEKHKFIGQYADSASGLDYLNARYYDGQRTQFLSEDAVFWEIGQTRDGKSALLNPQSQNSYSYAEDNPITKKDPWGRYVEISGTLIAPGRAWSAGIRFDSNGIDYFLSGGVGAGLSAGFEAMWAPGVMLSHTNQAAVTANGTVADVFGGRVSQNIYTYDPVTKKTIPNGDPVLGLVLGAGTGASAQFEGLAPIPYLVWNRPIAPSKLGSTANIPASIMSYSTYMNSASTPSQYVVQNNTTFARTSSGSLAPTSLPASVSQGGSTYYRNSSGLLSTKPSI
jgi:RHS repeat-associated protein